MYIDSHCHIHLYDKSIWNNIIRDSFSSDISYLLNVSVNLDNIDDMVDISNLDDRVLSSIGIHPCNTSNIDIYKAKASANIGKDR